MISAVDTTHTSYSWITSSSETARKYKKLLERFLLSIPDQVYEKKPNKQDAKNLVKHFVKLAKNNPELTTDIIATYIKEEKS